MQTKPAKTRKNCQKIKANGDSRKWKNRELTASQEKVNIDIKRVKTDVTITNKQKAVYLLNTKGIFT